MLCYGPLVSELGGQSAWCPQPRHWAGLSPRPPPRPGSAAYAFTRWCGIVYSVGCVSVCPTTNPTAHLSALMMW